MSNIPRVKDWIADVKKRLELAKPGTYYHEDLTKTLSMYEGLLHDLEDAHKPKQPELPLEPREPGE